MERPKKPCLGVALLLFFLLVAAANGAQLADAKETSAAADDGERVTVKTSGHGHGYSSHSGGHPNSGTPGQGGAGAVEPRNLNARSHRNGGAASRTLGYTSSPAACALVGAAAMLVLL